MNKAYTLLMKNLFVVAFFFFLTLGLLMISKTIILSSSDEQRNEYINTNEFVPSSNIIGEKSNEESKLVETKKIRDN